MNKNLATFQIISDIKPVPQADNIEKIIIKNTEVICKKGLYKIGDKIILYTLGAVVPEKDIYEELKNHYYQVRRISFKGEYSNGYILPAEIVLGENYNEYYVGDDLTDKLGVHTFLNYNEFQKTLQKLNNYNELIAENKFETDKSRNNIKRKRKKTNDELLESYKRLLWSKSLS